MPRPSSSESRRHFSQQQSCRPFEYTRRAGNIHAHALDKLMPEAQKQPVIVFDRPPGVLGSKLEPPTQRLALLFRERLVEELQSHLDRRLILVCAPAGYGKSTLLSQLFARLRTQGPCAAWLGIDAGDNDLVRLASHCTEALSLAGSHLPADPDRVVVLGASVHHGPESGMSDDAVIAQLLGVFERLTQDTWLFMDDVHLLTAPGVHRLLCRLLSMAGTRLHLVVASRERPNWPLARLRVSGQLHELEAARLAFDREESARVISELSSASVSSPQLASLHDKTEGWPASVQLVSIALREAEDVAAFLERFTGADRSVADFLVEEVLLQQLPDVQEFLLSTSVLKRFSTEMVNEVLDIDNARSLIDRVEALNLFVFSLDRERHWYRYHHLFADALRKRLTEESPRRVRDIHRRAGEWLSTHGYPVEAIDHALVAGDTARAGEWLDVASQVLFASGQTATLQHYADRIPPEVLKQLPRLQLELVWEDIIRWRFERARRVLPQVDARLHNAGPASADPLDGTELARLRTRLAHRKLMLDVFTDHLEPAHAAAQGWSTSNGFSDAFMEASVATAHMMCRRERFDCELAHARWGELRRSFVEARAVYGTVFLDTVAGGTLFMRGELAAAESAYVLARQTAAEIQGNDSALARMPAMQLAAVYYEMDRLDDARELLLQPGGPEQEFGLVDSVIARHITCARLAAVERAFVPAHRALDAATHTAERFDLPRVHAHVIAERVRLLIDEGLLRDAKRLMNDPRYQTDRGNGTTATPFDSTQERLAVARIRIAIEDGEFAMAHRLGRHWLTWLSAREADLATVRMAALLARALVRSGDRASAQRTLVNALKRAAPGHMLRTLADEGSEIGNLLAGFAPLIGESQLIPAQYLQELLGSFGQPDNPSMPQAVQAVAGTESGFSERELDILRLSASNFAAAEVARALGLTESTVKWYWQKIFEKTGVRRRSLAVRVARERGLID